MSPPISEPDFSVKLGPEQRADYAALPNEELRKRALGFLSRLKSRPKLGKPLRKHPTMGDLSDCRKLYFDVRDGIPPRWRIVYRLVSNEVNPTSIEIISIRQRAYADAYLIAALRLGRGVTPEKN